MPIDRPNQNPPRPLKPTLASSRTAAKTPLTPRLAAPQAPASTSASSTLSTRSARTSNGASSRVSTTAHDSITPVKAFLGTNITPRSSSRKSRVGADSASSTPSGTPTATPTNSRPTSTVDFPQSSGHSALGVRPRSIPAHSLATPTPRLQNHPPSETGSAKDRDVSSLFFHANDVRPPEQSGPQKKARVVANGKLGDTPRRQDAPSPPLSAVSRTRPDSKFFHADSLPEVRDRPPLLTPPPISISPEFPPPHSAIHGSTLRPPSPTKEGSHLSHRKGASQVGRPARNSAVSMLAGSNASDVPDRARRKSSATSSVIKRGHAKSASLSSIESVADLKKKVTNEPSAITPSPLHTVNRMVSNGSQRESVASAPSPPTTTFSGLPSPPQLSPNQNAGGKSPLELMNELAANARRERKVLDLEISNSSLLAINRSLEKEVRKQKAELRRFRRMSRAGQLLADTADPAPETYSTVGVGHSEDLSDMEEEEEVEETPEEEDPESDSSFDESSLSPNAQAQRDEAQRLRDAKRLQLDLSKHRDRLVDSQKMNQSLKRCLGWTDQLIKDGQKALQYQVRPSDIKLGGRVLVVEDDNEAAGTEESRGLLSPWSPLHQAIDSLDSPFFAESDRYIDRDSGVSGVNLDALKPVEKSHDNSHVTSSPKPDPSKSSNPVKEFRPHLPGQWRSYAITTPLEHSEKDKGLGFGSPEAVKPLASPFEERIRYLHASIDALEAS